MSIPYKLVDLDSSQNSPITSGIAYNYISANIACQTYGKVPDLKVQPLGIVKQVKEETETQQVPQQKLGSPVTLPRNDTNSTDIQSIDSRTPFSLDAAKKKCTELGFKPATEGYGKCVLQLSK